MSLPGELRQLLSTLREDPSIAPEIPVIRRMATKAMAWLMLTEFFLVVQVFPLKYFIDELSRDNPRVSRLLFVAVALGVLYKSGAFLRARMSAARNSTQWRMWRVWWGVGHARELSLSADWHTAHGTGEKESLVAKNIIKFEAMIDELLFDTLPVTLRITFTTAIMFYIGWPYGLLSLLTMVVYYVVMMRSERAVTPMRKDFRDRLKVIEKFGTEITANWRTIKEMGREKDFCAINDKLLMDFWRDEVPRHKRYLKYFTRQDDVVTYSRAALYALIGLLAYKTGQVELGTIVLATTWMERSYSNYARYSEFQMRLNEGLESLRELVQLMLLPPTIQQPTKPEYPEPITGEVIFDDVKFRYPDAEECSLRGVSFKVPACTVTAIVGPSGCGKSTLMKLTQREYDPDSGHILVDDIDLKSIDYNRYRRYGISIVSQDVQLFDTTILENIRMSRPEATEEEVIEAAKLANAHEFILELPNGYHTGVGENGVRLSGGQKQRIAIARALLRHPAILILDEATSALDALSQREVQITIERLIELRHCTIFIIAHRFSTIMCADQVVVLDKGLVAEIGTHEELNRLNGLYKRLRDMEANGLLD